MVAIEATVPSAENGWSSDCILFANDEIQEFIDAFADIERITWLDP